MSDLKTAITGYAIERIGTCLGLIEEATGPPIINIKLSCNPTDLARISWSSFKVINRLI